MKSNNWGGGGKQGEQGTCVRVRVTGRVSHGALEGNYKGMG